MTKREVVQLALEHNAPPYVPWSCTFTSEAADKLSAHFGTGDLDRVVDNHFLELGSPVGFFDDIGDFRFRDVFGVVWDRTVDRDIGIVDGCVLPEPTLGGYQFPDPLDSRFFSEIPQRIARHPDGFRRYLLGFSLYERAWSLRGMENLMMDFYEHPDFVRQLFAAIADYNIVQVHEALKHDIDAVHFGDDWGQQIGLQMGPQLWREFILPELTRMYSIVRNAGKYVSIHSCGDVDELFDDLIEAGVNCFNPFQPEVMDVFALMEQYRGRLAFHGGLSTQRVLPYGSPDDVKTSTSQLLEAGRGGGYVFAPAHAVEGDVSLENMLAFIETLHQQAGYARA